MTAEIRHRTADFDYDLPSELIAQQPAEPRDSARLLVVSRAEHSLTDHVFRELPEAKAAFAKYLTMKPNAPDAAWVRQMIG